MSDFNELKKVLRTTVTEAASAAKGIVSSAGGKAKSVGRLAKITLQISGERSGLEKAYSEIGRLCYEANKDAPGELYGVLFSQIQLTEAIIADLEEEAEAIKAGINGGGDFESVVSADEAAADVSVEIQEEK